jgi:hypothetical protein
VYVVFQEDGFPLVNEAVETLPAALCAAVVAVDEARKTKA